MCGNLINPKSYSCQSYFWMPATLLERLISQCYSASFISQFTSTSERPCRDVHPSIAGWGQEDEFTANRNGLEWFKRHNVRQAARLSPAAPNAPDKVLRVLRKCALQGKLAGDVALRARIYTATQHRMYNWSQVLQGLHYMTTDVCATASMNTSVLLSHALPRPGATCKARTSYTLLSLVLTAPGTGIGDYPKTYGASCAYLLPTGWWSCRAGQHPRAY